MKKCATKVRRAKRGKPSKGTSVPKKKIVTPVPLEILSELTHKLATAGPSGMLGAITSFHGMKGRFIYNVDVATERDKANRLRFAHIWLEITEKKSSKNSKRGAGR